MAGRTALYLSIWGLFAGCASASTLIRSDPWEYYTDYTGYKQGCRVCAHAELYPGVDPRVVTGWEENGKGQAKKSLIFADNTKQREWLVIDLGQPRPIGKLVLDSALHDPKRVPVKANVYGSLAGPDGPWTPLLEDADQSCRQTYLLDNPQARWVKIDFGESIDEIGSRLGRGFGIYKRFKLLNTAELMKVFHPKFSRECPGLEEFWKKIDAQDWTAAASALRTYEEKRHQKPASMPQEHWDHAKSAAADQIDFGNGIVFQFCNGVDWQIHPEKALNDAERGWMHSHIAKAWAITGEARYAKKASELLTSWLEQLPRPPETTSATYDQWSTLGTSARAGHFWQLLGLIVKDRQTFSDELFLNLLYNCWEMQDYLYHAGAENGNWLAAVTRSVLGGGRSAPEFADAPNWIDWARDHFVLNVMRDVYVDGKEEENSDGYVEFAYGILLGVYDMLKDAGVEIPKAVDRRIKLGVDWSSWILQPNGVTFMIGDSNGGAGPSTGTARKFDRPDLLYMNTQGKEGRRPSTNSRAFPVSGWYVMRSDWDERPWDQARQLLFTAAPYGPHGHQDQLSIYCYAYGRPLLWVPCRLNDSSYTTKEHWETLYTWSKNSVVVDGKSQPFGNEPGVDRTCKNVKWFSGKNLDLADATHTMYPDVNHRRRVLFVRDDYWIVIDDLTLKTGADPEKIHTYDQHFHFKEGTDAVTLPNGAVRTDYRTTGNLMLIPLEPEKFAASEKTSTPVCYIGQESPTMYGWKYRLEGKGAQRFVTVLYPYPKGKAPRVAVRKLGAAPGVAAVEITTPKGRDIVYASDAIESYRHSEKINARARVLLLRTDTHGAPVHATALDALEVNAGDLRFRGQGEAKSEVEL